ncbi:MAG: 3-isopropylmalate dehydratase small subunit [Clostridia bacterium]|nr:3-isopropylmalate dehydratase small subunit [Clostridia bacterium]MDE6211143.1 3-isopropylmalate dehydratase small subunit [Clostridia bacterium]MDE6605267.1 3-isopropylmalate dehydratase small subunit [Clostridia bacterium]MDE7208279.1 3-isopropylmalate dehydratase small subunit [Clostridia bacterium]
MMLKGKVFKFGDDIDTDIIVPATYLSTFDPKELAKHCMEYTNPEFYKEVKEGDIVVAGKNFGCGSSREHAPIAIKGCGVSIVIAKSFARIFYRNALNIGLYILECPEAVDGINAGDEVSVNVDTGVITNLTSGKTYQAHPFPKFIQNIIECGGLINAIKAKKI